MSLSLDALFAQSQQLTAHIVASSSSAASAAPGGSTAVGLPQDSVERGLAQIDAQTRRLAAFRTPSKGSGADPSPPQHVNASTAFLLATKGFDAEKVVNTIAALTAAADATVETANSAAAAAASSAATRFPTAIDVDPASLADIDRFLRAQHQTLIASAIEGARRDAENDCIARCDASIHRDWARSKKRVFAEIGVSGGSLSGKNLNYSLSTPKRTQQQAGFSSISRLSSTSMPGSTPAKSMPQVSLQMLPKHRAYAAALQVINAAKMSSNEQNLFSLFFDTNIKLERSSSVVGNPGANFSAASHLGRCWRLLNDMFGDVDGWQKSKLEIKRIYKLLGEDGVSSCDEAIAFRKRIVAGGKQHLQSIYYEFIQQVVVQNRVQIGGMPTVHTYVDSFISLKFTKNGAWNSSVGMEISNGAATWAHMYYLLRCGLYSEALDYCANPAFERVADSRFFGWLTMFVKTGKLSAAGVAQIRDEWNSRIRPALAADSVPQNNGNVNARARVDPFKAAVYKILGRCELSSKIIKSTDVAPAVEDYLWLQLMLIDEDAAAGGPSARAVSPADRYTLRDMSVLMQKYGANHFSPQNRSPLVYFEVLLLCGEFERAVAFLYSSTAMGGSLPDLTTGTNTSALDAIHFAIALADSGVLRVPDNPRGFEAARSSDVLVTRVGEDGYEVACFLLPKVIHAYARLFFNRVDCVEAMHYLLVLGSVGTKLRDDDDDEVDGMDAIGEMVVSASAASGKDYTRIAHGYLRELLLACVKDSWACEALLGVSASTANIRVGGEIEKYMKLVYLSSFSDLVKRVLVPAAEEAVHKGRLEDAVKLFDYAQEYSTVVSILCKQLSEHFVTDSNAALQAQGSAGDSVGLFGLFNNQNSGFNKPSQVGMTGSGVSVMNASPAPKPSNSDASATEALVTASINRLEAYMSRPAIAQGIPDSARRTAAQLVALQTVVRNFAAAKYEDAVEAVKALRLVPTSAADMSLVLRSAEDFLALDANVAKCVPNLLVVAMEALVRVHMAYKEAARYGEAMRGAKLDEFKSIGRAVILYAGGIQYRIPSDVFARLNRLEVLMS